MQHIQLILTRQMARHILKTTYEISQAADAPDITKKQWELIRLWLNADSIDLTEQQWKKWENIFTSYVAKQKEFEETALEENWPIVSIPNELLILLRSILGHKDNNTPKTKESVFQKIQSLNQSLNAKSRFMATSGILWFLYVVVRTQARMDLLGIYLERWDEEYFWLNLLLPPATILFVVYASKWIKNGAIK